MAADGEPIGRHAGLHRYTVGQRRGIGIPGPEPLYVLRLDPGENRLVVGSKDDLAVRSCRVAAVNWIAPPPAPAPSLSPNGPPAVRVQVRYRHEAAPARILPGPNGEVEVRFDAPQSAVTPGQGAVFFRDDEVLGGGVIAEAP